MYNFHKKRRPDDIHKVLYKKIKYMYFEREVDEYVGLSLSLRSLPA